MAGLAQAQTAAPASQEFQYPSVRSKDGSLAALDPAHHRHGRGWGAGAGGDQRYPGQQVRVRTLSPVSDRAAVSNAQMQAGVAQCLRELEQRRRSSRGGQTAGRGRSGAGPGFRVVMGITFTLIDFRPAQGPEL